MRLHQTNNLCTVKETINKIKRPPTEQKKILANNNPGWIFKAHNELIQVNTKNKPDNMTKKQTEDLNKYSPKDDRWPTDT